MELTDTSVAEAIRIHADECYPNESCGVVTSDGYIRFNNVAADPANTFDCNEQLAPYLAEGSVMALVHSHVNGPYNPSFYDMKQQIAMDVPWGLVISGEVVSMPVFFWGDSLPVIPLLERQFRYGPSGTDGKGDCAALVRDWYRIERNILIPEYPRESRSWTRPGVSYNDNVLSAGFVEADRRNPEVGDVFTASIRSQFVNHSGIYVGGGLIMHQLEGRLSRIDPAISWMRFVMGWFRYAS